MQLNADSGEHIECNRCGTKMAVRVAGVDREGALAAKTDRFGEAPLYDELPLDEQVALIGPGLLFR